MTIIQTVSPRRAWESLKHNSFHVMQKAEPPWPGPDQPAASVYLSSGMKNRLNRRCRVLSSRKLDRLGRDTINHVSVKNCFSRKFRVLLYRKLDRLGPDTISQERRLSHACRSVLCVHEKSLEHSMECFIVQKAGLPISQN